MDWTSDLNGKREENQRFERRGKRQLKKRRRIDSNGDLARVIRKASVLSAIGFEDGPHLLVNFRKIFKQGINSS